MLLFDHFLVLQTRLHPSMQPQDVMKYCFQSVYGGEHLLTDLDSAKAYFDQEYASLTAASGELYEQISPQIYRVNLAAWKEQGLPSEWLFTMFALSAKRELATESDFSIKLKIIESTLPHCEVAFSIEDWQDYKVQYLKEGIRPIHHSDSYRQKEKPAYRLVSDQLVRLIPLLKQLANYDSSQVKVIAIDGRAAAGKTTIATNLAQILGAGLVQMDDFFLPQALRTKARLGEAGGNVHYERFSAEVLPYLSSGEEFAYQKFDCEIMALTDFHLVKKSNWRIVEGAYSCHPRFGDYMDLRVFADATQLEQTARISKRETEESAALYATRWIPMEEAYIKEYQLVEKADLVI